MAAWGTEDMAAALPAQPATDVNVAAPTSDFKNPQEHGWVPKANYDYDTYNKSSKELAEAQASAQAPADSGEVTDAVGGIRPGDWASNAAIYVWNDEFGDVGPSFPDLEKQLFGSEFHVKTGLNYKK